ncbi:MAG: hypothetical protein BWX47_00537 [candidate division Hyd24-12 bacterium ADurb.Bin004]|nr:MAG: hypothetical protein AO395_06175 [Candidatus Fermentibacter daniensis]OQC70262.1 MAG: hypothetical protein BWX47_00537 [candidate division Hyd24-12 bacterium ADurb.Bin004]HPN63241.1 hypothetical protein [Candidatus Fermentibacter daniensis]
MKLRIFLPAAGVLMVFAGVFGDSIGLSRGSGFGYGQFFICLTGIVLIVAGFAGRRFPAVYKRASLVLMNTILLLMLLEFTSLMITRVFPFDFPDGADLRALRQREQIRETGLVFPSREFTPYLIWRSEGTSLPLMNVDSLGLRHTTYSCAAGDSMQIIALGGSAMWGWMVPDSLTIPSLLQKNLNERLGRGSCSVRNYAENGYVSTQDLIRLILSLQRGERPSMVIMYDGFNDVLAACENAAAGTVIGQSGIEARWASTPVSTGPSSLLNFLGGLRTVAVIRELIPNRNSAEEGPEVLVLADPSLGEEGFDLEALATETASMYKANYSIVAALSESMGFRFVFVLQPYLYSGIKPLTPSEEAILQNENPVILKMASLVYEDILADAELYPNIVTLDTLLAEVDETVFTDICHMTPEGNRVMANAICGYICKDR